MQVLQLEPLSGTLLTVIREQTQKVTRIHAHNIIIDDLPNSVPDLGTSTRGGNSDSATCSRSQGKDSLFIA